jgi:molybdopterin converting factor small subunit
MFVGALTPWKDVRTGMTPSQQTEAAVEEAPDAESDAAGEPESDAVPAAATDSEAETTVTVRCTGHVRTELGEYEFEFTFAGDTLRAFLDELFEEYPELQEMLIAETEADATHSGWAPTPEELPGTWTKNPVGEQTTTYARILVNGHFNENENGFDTELEEGDRVALVYPFMFCC